MSTLKPLIVILGPTASGKTELALELAKKFNGEIINADSRQIYKEMDIGTGKIIILNQPLSFPQRRESTVTFSVSMPANSYNKNYVAKWIPAGVYPVLRYGTGMTEKKHSISNNISIHLINIINPDQKFSLAQYKKLAVEKIKEIQTRNKTPFLVGGTGLYISSIVDNLEIPKAPPDNKIRERLEKLNSEELFEKLRKIDLKSAEIIGENNKRKLIRALEVYEITGKTFSAQQTKGEPLFNTLQIGIKTDREKLYKKIDQRVDKMIEIGLIEEVKKLAEKYSFDLPAMSGIGYQEIGSYLQNKTILEEAVQKIKFRTHQYARRQMTWFRKNKRIKWIEDYKKAEKLISEFLNK